MTEPDQNEQRRDLAAPRRRGAEAPNGSAIGSAGTAARPDLGGVSVLSRVRPLAALGIVALVLGRAVGPSSAGIAIGVARATETLELAGALASQLFALVAAVVLMSELFVAATTKLPTWVRIGLVVLGGFVQMVLLAAAAMSVRRGPAIAVSACASLTAIAAAWDARRTPFVRQVALVIGAVGVSSLARLGALLMGGVERPAPWQATGSRLLAMLAFAVAVLAIAVAGTWLTGRSRRITTPLTLVVLAIAFLVTRTVLATDLEQAAPWALLLRRSVERLTFLPPAVVSPAAQLFVAALTPLVAGAVLLARDRLPHLSGAIALAIIVRSSPEMPLGGVAILIASLSLLLFCRDERGIWAAISDGHAERRRRE